MDNEQKMLEEDRKYQRDTLKKVPSDLLATEIWRLRATLGYRAKKIDNLTKDNKFLYEKVKRLEKIIDGYENLVEIFSDEDELDRTQS